MCDLTTDEFCNNEFSQKTHDSYQDSLKHIQNLRNKNPFNPLIGYLNINSLRNKIVDVREILTKFSPDYFVFAETKLDESFPSSQFQIENYELRTRKDRNKHGGGLIEYVRKGVVCKQFNVLDFGENEVICSELTIRNKKWVIFSASNRPPLPFKLEIFFPRINAPLFSSIILYKAPFDINAPFQVWI